MTTFFTIGHSTRTLTEFVALVQEFQIDLVVDVRSIPRSRTNPQFDKKSFSASLRTWHIGYEHIAELGGLRGKSRRKESSPNSYWKVRGFRNYADYALTAPFASGLARLQTIGKYNRSAIMCAEAVWWRYHRRIIADYLVVAGENVIHILTAPRVDQASMTSGAVVQHDGTILYSAERKHLDEAEQ